MSNLAFKMALRDWKKIILIAIVLAFAGSMFIYYNTVMFEMRHFSPNNINMEESDAEKFRDMKVPTTKSEMLVAAMTMLIVLAAVLFQLNMLVVDMINKKKEYYALQVIGVSEEQVELFPLLYSILAGALASLIIAAVWIPIFPYFKSALNIHAISLGLIILVIILFFVMSTIIGVKAREITDYME